MEKKFNKYMELLKVFFMVGLIVLLSMFFLSNKDNFFIIEGIDINMFLFFEGVKVILFFECGDLGYFFVK